MAFSRVEAFSELGKDILERDRERGRVEETARAQHVSTKSALSSMEEKSAANQYRLKSPCHSLSHKLMHTFSFFSLSARQSETDRNIEA